MFKTAKEMKAISFPRKEVQNNLRRREIMRLIRTAAEKGESHLNLYTLSHFVEDSDTKFFKDLGYTVIPRALGVLGAHGPYIRW